MRMKTTIYNDGKNVVVESYKKGVGCEYYANGIILDAHMAEYALIEAQCVFARM